MHPRAMIEQTIFAMSDEGWVVWVCLMVAWTVLQGLCNLIRVDED